MILDHIEFFDSVDVPKGDIKLRAVYHVAKTATLDISKSQGDVNDLKVELAKSIREQMVKDLSGYFDDSFTEEDVLYITGINHRQLDEMRQLAEITKYMSVEQVQKILTTYALLVDIGLFSKENDNA